jgi:hypothetical protein
MWLTSSGTIAGAQQADPLIRLGSRAFWAPQGRSLQDKGGWGWRAQPGLGWREWRAALGWAKKGRDALGHGWVATFARKRSPSSISAHSPAGLGFLLVGVGASRPPIRPSGFTTAES